MKLTLIITTYNRPDALELVLKSVENQNITPSEVVVADDGSNNKTKDLIINFNKKSNINIIHSWQEDVGFRASRSRNKAILKSSGDYIVLIDGDMILHPNFIKDHIFNAEPGYFIQGYRVLLSKEQTSNVISKKLIYFPFLSFRVGNKKNSIYSKLLSKLFSNKNNHLRGAKTCNMSFYLKDCLNINGFNNDFEGWGREDSEFVSRLINNGVKRKNIRFCAIQYHLWHNESSKESLIQNHEMLEASIKNNMKWCANGINTNES